MRCYTSTLSLPQTRKFRLQVVFVDPNVPSAIPAHDPSRSGASGTGNMKFSGALTLGTWTVQWEISSPLSSPSATVGSYERGSMNPPRYQLPHRPEMLA